MSSWVLKQVVYSTANEYQNLLLIIWIHKLRGFSPQANKNPQQQI
jgi:hypothetical protein